MVVMVCLEIRRAGVQVTALFGRIARVDLAGPLDFLGALDALN
jgi:hypothetical protein